MGLNFICRGLTWVLAGALTGVPSLAGTPWADPEPVLASALLWPGAEGPRSADDLASTLIVLCWPLGGVCALPVES